MFELLFVRKVVRKVRGEGSTLLPVPYTVQLALRRLRRLSA